MAHLKAPQVIAQNGNTTPRRCNKALASSPFWEKTYRYDAPQTQEVYDALVNMTGCAGSNSLQCLQEVDVQTIRTAALAISSSHTYNTSSYTWAPVIDDIFLTQPLSSATAKGQVNIDYGFGMYNLHEGQNFIPLGLQNITSTGSPPVNSSLASFNTWLSGFLPNLSPHNTHRLTQHIYPPAGRAENLPTYNTTYIRAGLIYRDVTLACPALWMAESAHQTSYLGVYTMSPATHGSDTEWWNQVNAIQASDPLIYDGYTGAFASFFATADPNAHKLTNASVVGVPELKATGEEFVIGSEGFGNVEIPLLRERCAFWRSVAHEIDL